MHSTTNGRPSRPGLSRRLAGAVILAAAALAAGCGRSEAEKVIDESIAHLEAAERMMERAAGDQDKLLVAVMSYRREHAGEFSKLRLRGARAFAGVPEAERRRLADRVAVRVREILGRIHKLAQEFKDPKLALRLVRPLAIAAATGQAPTARRPSAGAAAPPGDRHASPLPERATPAR